MPDQPKGNWQVPWDEHFLSSDGSALLDEEAPDKAPDLPSFRVAFFCHYLDLGRPLLVETAAIPLPPPTPRPQRLGFLRYEEP